MKRSEMVLKLQDIILERILLSDVITFGDASEILHDLEKAGMLPPCDYVNNGGSSSMCGHQLCTNWKEEE